MFFVLFFYKHRQCCESVQGVVSCTSSDVLVFVGSSFYLSSNLDDVPGMC